jgi:hypothetical protein
MLAFGTLFGTKRMDCRGQSPVRCDTAATFSQALLVTGATGATVTWHYTYPLSFDSIQNRAPRKWIGITVQLPQSNVSPVFFVHPSAKTSLPSPAYIDSLALALALIRSDPGTKTSSEYITGILFRCTPVASTPINRLWAEASQRL